MKTELIAGGLGLALLFGTYQFGHYRGYAKAEDRIEEAVQANQDEVDELTGTIERQAGELLVLKYAREEEVDELEQQAIEATGADGPGIGATGGLQRLDSRWGRD